MFKELADDTSARNREMGEVENNGSDYDIMKD